MDWAREYLLSVTAAAILCSCITAFFKKKGAVSSLIKTVCGLFVCLVILQPVIHISLPDISSYFTSISVDTGAHLQDAQVVAIEEKCRVIKQNAESYICDKATTMGGQITACVILSEQEPYAPAEITIYGSISPYTKSKLSEIISSDLGISRENQKWSN